MTLAPEFAAALLAADAAGVWLRIDSGRLMVTPGWADLPPDARDTLRRHKPALLALLAAHPRPEPTEVWFVRRNLAVYPVHVAPPGQRHFWVGGKVYHRLTPAVLAYLGMAISRRWAGLSPDARDDLARLMLPLYAYVVRHFRPDQLDRADAAPPATLPEPPCPAP